MKIKNKILAVIIIVFLLNIVVISSIWYIVSSRTADTYLKDISDSTMTDACHAFEYLLTDTSYMASLISLNDTNIVQPIRELNKRSVMKNGQWNQEYLNNKRLIEKYIRGLNGYKYYIVGITVIANENCIFSSSHIMQNENEIYQEIIKLDQEALQKKIVMLDPIHIDGGKSTYSSDYVVPAVKGITDYKKNIIGYTIVYFDYGVIEDMFSANLPEGSYFQVINENGSLIFSNCGNVLLDDTKPSKDLVYNSFKSDAVDWTFTMALPSDYYMAGISHTVLITGLLMILILIMAAVISAIIISKITTEITELCGSMQEIAEGNFSVQYSVKHEDEIGQMGHTFNYMVIHIKKLMEQISTEEKQKRKIEMDFLQAQINPHFISNVLNNVVWMANIQHTDNIAFLVTSLNSLLQGAMHQGDDMILLRKELEYVNHYLTIIEYSGSYDFIIEKFIEKETENLYVLKFIMQPILENAIYHGLPENLLKEGKIKIGAYMKENNLFLIVEDNGNGMTENQIQEILSSYTKDKNKFNGIGIRNVNERIKLYFGKEYGLYYESVVGEYTKAVFVLPIIKQLGEEKKNVKDQAGGCR